MKKSKRLRKAVNLTLSAEARELGGELAEARGLRLTQLVDMLLRAELRRVGKLPPEGPART